MLLFLTITAVPRPLGPEVLGGMRLKLELNTLQLVEHSKLLK